MIGAKLMGIGLSDKGGRALAGLALLLCAAGCSESAPETHGPNAASAGEEAALRDAAAMLEAREPQETSAADSASEASDD